LGIVSAKVSIQGEICCVAANNWKFVSKFVLQLGIGLQCVAQSPILLTTSTIHRLKQRGYTQMLDVYYELNPSLNEPLPEAGGVVCVKRLPALSKVE